MHIVVLATATDSACLSESEEGARFQRLREQLAEIGVKVTHAWNLLGKHDYLLILDVGPKHTGAFAAMSLIAQTGTMRTESMVAMPLTEYFDIAGEMDEHLGDLRPERTGPRLSR